MFNAILSSPLDNQKNTCFLYHVIRTCKKTDPTKGSKITTTASISSSSIFLAHPQSCLFQAAHSRVPTPNRVYFKQKVCGAHGHGFGEDRLGSFGRGQVGHVIVLVSLLFLALFPVCPVCPASITPGFPSKIWDCEEPRANVIPSPP